MGISKYIARTFIFDDQRRFAMKRNSVDRNWTFQRLVSHLNTLIIYLKSKSTFYANPKGSVVCFFSRCLICSDVSSLRREWILYYVILEFSECVSGRSEKLINFFGMVLSSNTEPCGTPNLTVDEDDVLLIKTCLLLPEC